MQAAAKIDSKISSQQLPHVKSTETVQGPNHRTGERVYQKRVLSYIQLFREELSEKSARDNPERYCGWFLFHFCSKKSERRAREAMYVCLWVLKESNKSTFEGYYVRNSELIISHVTFRDCRVHIFSDNLSRNSCICTITDWRVNKTFKTSSINSCASLNTVPGQRLYIKRNIFRIKLL